MRQLNTRFKQLNSATELELWQEAFRSIEDVHGLMILSKKPIKGQLMANYYEKLARIFQVGENWLFHSTALSRYHATVLTRHGEEEFKKTASCVLLSALSIPIIVNKRHTEGEESKARLSKLSSLVRAQRPPTRDSLLKEAVRISLFSSFFLSNLSYLFVHFHDFPTSYPKIHSCTLLTLPSFFFFFPIHL